MTLKLACVIILFLYYMVYIGINLVNHGKPQRITPRHLMISNMICYTLLILGGFFTVFHWPQIVSLCISALAWGMMIASGLDGVKTKYNVFSTIIGTALGWWIYWCGGFWF